MKICFVTTGLGVGGAEKQVCDLADKFHDEGHEVLIIAITGEIKVRPKTGLIRIVEISAAKSFISIFKTLLLMRKTIREYSPDVVHSHMLHANLYCRALRIFTPMRILISTAHNSYEGKWYWMLLYRLTDWVPTISTNVSQASVDSFVNSRASTHNRMVKFYNGINCDKYHFSPINRSECRTKLGLVEDQQLILAVGRLTEAKNYFLLLEAFSELQPSHKNIRLAIIGDGPDRESLYHCAQKIGISSFVDFLGNRDDVDKWMSAADIFAMSSTWEGMPLVICEAMCTERVVVSTDCGGIKEILDGNEYLVPVNDRKLYTEALRLALELSPTERDRIGIQNRKKVVDSFSLDTIATNWLSFYKSLK